MYTALQGVVQHGTAHAAMVLNRFDLGGKTGTTNDQVDAWFVGFNRNIVTTTWMGYDQPASLHRYAAELALPMWIDFMKTVLPGLPTVMPTPPKNVIAVSIDPASGLLARKNQSNAIIEYFREDTIPTEVSSSTTQENTVNNTPTEDLF
jgi:penicillin-binding protein 1A